MKPNTFFRRAIQLCLAVLACPVMGQVAKKDLTRADYDLWSRLYARTLSENGQWALYSLSYDSGPDTLFVKCTKGKRVYDFPKGREGNFFGEEKFACLQNENQLCLVDLKSGKKQEIPKIVKYQITKQHLVIAEADTGSNGKKLTLYRENGEPFFSIQDVTAWSYNGKSDAIVYHAGTVGNRVLVLQPLANPANTIKVAGAERDSVSDFSWQDNGQSVAFFKQFKGNIKLGLLSLGTGRYQEVRVEEIPIVRTRHSTASTFSIPLSISPDGERVFFGIQNTIGEENDEQVELWNAADKVTYPEKKALAGNDGINKMGFWEPEKNHCGMISDNGLPRCSLSPDGKHALLWDPFIYQPQQKMFPDTDYHVLDIASGNRKLLLEKQVGVDSWTAFSPTGKFVIYFRDKCWWVYNPGNGETVNLTKNLSVRFDEEDYDWPDEASPYGCPGWTKDDGAVLVYDRYDVWKISPGGTAIRLTSGRETNTVFRIARENEIRKGSFNRQGKGSGVFDLSKGLWLETINEKGTGFYYWDQVKGCLPVASSRNSLTSLVTVPNSDKILYVEQNYNLPPRLMFQKGRSAATTIYQSNPQHFNYKWGHPEMIHYQNSKGEKLQGILYYPAGYDAMKKYPVIVHIYQKLSWAIRDYENPTVRLQSGFNKTNFVTEGYFVFEPDIKYELRKPGLSAVDCVTAGVNAIYTVSGVDRERIGLIGHSFGGYETNFILGKTDLFSAAVSSAGISDLTSHFLNFNLNSNRPNNFHFESGQFRMTKPLFEDREAYEANSPMNFIQNISTPLLSWTGKDDPQVSPVQSMQLHMALRRLGKRNIMLVYPNEHHTLMQKDDQEDLVKRVFEWFGHYLKGEPEADWMKANKI
jgi:dipeptidyl aminopeptidase/acylaminoacyl peptidase